MTTSTSSLSRGCIPPVVVSSRFRAAAWINRRLCDLELSDYRYPRGTRGLTAKLARKLYTSMAIPAMLYAADVYITPLRMDDSEVSPCTRQRGSVGIIRKLEKVHRQAALMITGGMSTSPTDTTIAHSGLRLLYLVIDKICQQAVTRMISIPPSHPLFKHVSHAGRRYVKAHRSPLTELLYAFKVPVKPGTTETIPAIWKSPAWRPLHSTQIEKDMKLALSSEKEWSTKFGIRIYTDGSDFGGGVGASAILYTSDNTLPTATLRYYLGPSSNHTVYEAEIVGLLLGAELLRKVDEAPSASIAADNQPCIQASTNNHPVPGHHLLCLFHSTLKKAIREHRLRKDQITIR